MERSNFHIHDEEGEAALDSEDLTPVRKGGSPGVTQRGAVHEVGHMLGLRDEYADEHAPEREVGEDPDSIMNVGEKVLPEHYEPIAEAVSAASKQKFSVSS